ncbi:hypothetical protein PMZ80_004518 [Knufia obscura]|uniref:Uncharacterized protein n=2 Tax=Knufia TaxID=430999 RepID=A0AAN8EC13_9EURO|nr:hypothetical protein PMZ80_004518 [Knufia obscura]KAK5951603.1 hypothetical protein OHC33_007281 [Knufia fluminis]
MASAAVSQSRHTYGQSTIDGDARVQLGDVNTYSYHYTTSDAKDAIYSNALLIPIREMLEHPSLRGYFAAAGLSRLLSDSRRVAIQKKLDTLEQYLSRMQEIEKRQIESSRARDECARIIGIVIADARVSVYMQHTEQLFLKLSRLAKRRCSENNISLCNDDFCHLTERLQRQIAARKSIDRVVGRMSSALHHMNGSSAIIVEDSHNAQRMAVDANSVRAQIQPDVDMYELSDEAQEYLYATQDFWRQLSSVLKSLALVEKHCLRTVLSFLLAPVIAYILLFGLARGIMMLAGEDSGQANRIALSLAAVPAGMMLVLMGLLLTMSPLIRLGHRSVPVAMV